VYPRDHHRSERRLMNQCVFLGSLDEGVARQGRDRVSGGDGSDLVLVADGRHDVATCGGGRDEVRADRLDVVARDCELVRRGK
jgi:hypothetical protein